MSKYPKPWRIEQTDQDHYAVLDANNLKLFFISGDDNPDGDDPPGGLDGPTILGSDSAADDDLLAEIMLMFAKGEVP